MRRADVNPPVPSRSLTIGSILAFVLILASCGTDARSVEVPVAGAGGRIEQMERGEPEERPSTSGATSTTSSASTTTTDSPSTSTGSTSTTSSTSTSTTTTTTSTTTTTTTTTTTVAPPSTVAMPPPPKRPLANPFLGATNDAFDRLARDNAAASLTVVRGGEVVFTRAAGHTIDGHDATGDSPMVVASVSKVVVAVAVARLHAAGELDVAAPVPWADIGLAPDPRWGDVTVRELLDHGSGLAKSRFSWFTGDGTCRDHVSSFLSAPPRAHRGTWVYSNGNYCLLGLLVEQRTGLALGDALQQLVFDPVGADGAHDTYGGLQPGDVDHPNGVERLSRLGGAGTLVVSTDDLARALGRLTPGDLAILQSPGVFTDQYGWGHTGTIDGAKACAWVLDDGDTVVAATIAGDSTATGGGVCDIVVPAIALDLGIAGGRPARTP